MAAKVSGFAAIFTDVDLPDGSRPGDKNGTVNPARALSVSALTEG